MSNLLNVEIICKCIVHLKSNRRIVLPHIYFLENDSDFTERRIENWYKQLSKEDKNRYATIIKDNVMGNFLTEYPHNNDVNKLDKIIMLTRGGVKSLIGYIYKKGKNDAARAAECMDSFNNAFSHVEQSKLKQNVFDDIEYEDRQYKIDDILNNMNINDSTNITIVVGDKNKVNAQYKVNENKKSFIVPKWLRVSCWVIFAITICWLVLSVWYHYTTTDKILEFFVSFFWYDWLILMLNVISIIIALRK